jgi:hypothetical protein
MPDFGYQDDNYLIDRGEEGYSKWKVFTDLLEDSKRFGWLMNFIMYKKLNEKVNNIEVEQQEIRKQKK